MTRFYDSTRHVVRMDPAKIPAELAEIGPRDIVSVTVTKIDTHGREEARYAIPAKLIEVESPSNDFNLDPIDELVFSGNSQKGDEGDAGALPC